MTANSISKYVQVASFGTMSNGICEINFNFSTCLDYPTKERDQRYLYSIPQLFASRVNKITNLVFNVKYGFQVTNTETNHFCLLDDIGLLMDVIAFTTCCDIQTGECHSQVLDIAYGIIVQTLAWGAFASTVFYLLRNMLSYFSTGIPIQTVQKYVFSILKFKDNENQPISRDTRLSHIVFDVKRFIIKILVLCFISLYSTIVGTLLSLYIQ